MDEGALNSSPFAIWGSHTLPQIAVRGYASSGSRTLPELAASGDGTARRPLSKLLRNLSIRMRRPLVGPGVSYSHQTYNALCEKFDAPVGNYKRLNLHTKSKFNQGGIWAEEFP
jgi:hypothetical protein